MYQMHSYGEAVQLDPAGDTLKFIKPDARLPSFIFSNDLACQLLHLRYVDPRYDNGIICEGIVKGLSFSAASLITSS